MIRQSLYDVLNAGKNMSNPHIPPIINLKEFENSKEAYAKCHILSSITKTIIREFSIDTYEVAIALHIGHGPSDPSIVFLKSMYSPEDSRAPLKLLFVPDFENSYILMKSEKLGTLKINDISSYSEEILPWRSADKYTLLGLNKNSERFMQY